MSELPLVTSATFTEREGVIAVERAVNAARCLWRPLDRHDVGIDGHIEYVTGEGKATGRLVGVQVKSGRTYFASASGPFVAYAAEERHSRYWSEYPLPVILVLHHPETHEMIWTDVRHQLRLGAAIRVARNARFDESGVRACLASAGPLPTGAFDPTAVLTKMAITGPQGLCYLYLFAQGMTDLAQSVYFGMDVVDEVLDYLAAHAGMPSFGIGAAEFEFIDSYVGFLVAEDLARIDFASWKQVNDERQMVGTFIAPLTAKGRAVRDLVVVVDRGLPAAATPYDHAIQERFVQMVFNPSGVDEFGGRQGRLLKIRSRIDEQSVT